MYVDSDYQGLKKEKKVGRTFCFQFNYLKLYDCIYPIPVVGYSGHYAWLVLFSASDSPGNHPGKFPFSIWHFYHHWAA